MDKQVALDKHRIFEERLQAGPPAEWVRKMVEHYRRTGTFRAQNLRRLLGDPTEGVEVGPNSSLASNLASHKLRTS